MKTTYHLTTVGPLAATTQVDTLPRCLMRFAGLLRLVKLPHFKHVWLARLLQHTYGGAMNAQTRSYALMVKCPRTFASDE